MRHCLKKRLRIIPVAVPDELASDARAQWWMNRTSVLLVLKEYMKYGLYKLFPLSL
jgi:hypothetical protein